MIANHLLTGLSFGLSLSIISWMVGIIGTALLQKTRYYERMSDLNFIASEAVNELLGIEQFKRIVKKSFFRFLNQSFNVSLVFGLAMMIPNAVLNLYPSLLQQENKRRIDRLLGRVGRKELARG